VQAISAGLVDESQMIVCPVVVGGGKRFFPDGVRLDLELPEERRFVSGVANLRYGIGGFMWDWIGREGFRDPARLAMACGEPAAGHHSFFSVLAAAGR
jgi:hypothetical protein